MPYRGLAPRDFTDGLSGTICAAEVKAFRPYYRDAASASAMPIPADSSSLCGQGNFKATSGHTEWVDGRSHQTGFTSVFTPNTEVICNNGGQDYDVDWTNQREGNSTTVVTYAAVTARSYHPDVVNVAMMDGSARAVSDLVELDIWRALSTREGEEVAQ